MIPKQNVPLRKVESSYIAVLSHEVIWFIQNLNLNEILILTLQGVSKMTPG